MLYPQPSDLLVVGPEDILLFNNRILFHLSVRRRLLTVIRA